MKYLVPIFCLLLPVAAQADSDWLKRYWVVPAGDAILELKIEDEELKVTIAATLNPDHQDSQNPDKHQRENRLVGLMLAHGFKLDDGEWQNGSIYDPG